MIQSLRESNPIGSTGYAKPARYDVLRHDTTQSDTFRHNPTRSDTFCHCPKVVTLLMQYTRLSEYK